MKYCKNYIKKFHKKKIVVLGDLMLDKFIWGKIERINPEQPAAPLVKRIYETLNTGGAGNVAKNVVCLGAKCDLYGILGKDDSGRKLENLIYSDKINFFPFYSENPTIVKQRIMAHKQQIARLDYGEEKMMKDSDLNEKIISEFKRNEVNYDFVILSDYNKHLFSESFAQEIIKNCNKFNIPVLSDPKPQNADYFKRSFIISPNLNESQKISGINYNGKNLTDISEKIKRKLETEYVIITCGEEGVFVYKDKLKNLQIPTIAKNVSNPTGAGDTFAATLSLGISSGLNVFDAAKVANYAAGIVVEKIGTATTDQKELIKRLKRH